MSVVVAVKENGVVYMGADSQTSAGSYKEYFLNECGFKIFRLENGILASFCGNVGSKHTICSLENVFTLDENGNLTKRHIVNNIIPKLVAEMNKIGNEETGKIDVSILLAHKDSLYKICMDLSVLKQNTIAIHGSGMEYTYYALSSEGNVKDRILQALSSSAKRTESVSGPFVLIDTKKLEYEIVDMGGKNY
ncbi:MAG: hypothetical protein E7353_02300 [Clostridiales bacterium]|nr:hypothetical protein [Clostridiales bacterium]